MAREIVIQDPIISPRTSQDFTNVPALIQGASELKKVNGVWTERPKGTMTLSDGEMRRLHEMFSMWDSSAINEGLVLDNFNRFYALYPEMELPQNLKSYVFITRPEMNIYSGKGRSQSIVYDNKSDPMMAQYNMSNPEILQMCTREYSDMHDFMPYLQGRTLSLQLTDYQIKSSDFIVPTVNYKFSYPTVTNESTTGGSFDITFREDKELRITKLFNWWIYYMDAVNKGRIKVDRNSHLLDNSYDYMCSVYELICDPTSEWILFWFKYTGCFPTSVPNSNLSFSLGDSFDNKVGVSFQYIRAEAMDPAIIGDFMSNVNINGVWADPESDTYLPLRDRDFDITGPSLASCPVIVVTNDGKYLLKWKACADGPASRLKYGDVTLQSTAAQAQQDEAYVEAQKAAAAMRNIETEYSRITRNSLSGVNPLEQYGGGGTVSSGYSSTSGTSRQNLNYQYRE